MRARSGNRRFRLLAVLLGIVVAIVLAEAGLRLVGRPESEADTLAELALRLQPPPLSGDRRAPAPQARLREIVEPSRHPDVIYELRPNVETCFEQVPVRINSERVRRSSPISARRPQRGLRILVLGDSHAFGWAIPEDATVSAQLEEALRVTSPSAVEVLNAGVPGYSAYQEAAWLDARGAALEPDCVIVLFVANDMGLPHFLLRPSVPGPSRLWDRIKAATASKRWFSFAPNQLATFVSEVQIERIPQRYRHMVGETGYREALRRMSDRAAQDGFELVNVFDYSTLDVDSEALIEYQQHLGIAALEMPWPMDPTFRVGKTDPHLNRAGNAKIAGFLVRSLVERGVCTPARLHRVRHGASIAEP